jgi:hypothetical protein
MNSPIKEYIYILELNGGNYYVGKTKDIAKRFNDHKSQKGSAWTRQHGGPKIIEIYECTSLFDEDKYTLEYMNAVGVDNVRGGSYSNCVLTIEQLNNITRALRNANNLCMTCGESGHFADICGTHKNDMFTTKSCNTIHNNSYTDNISTNYGISEELRFPHVRYLSPTGIVHDDTEKIENGIDNIHISNIGVDYSSSCGRCGRNNHVITKCFAKTDIHGKLL